MCYGTRTRMEQRGLGESGEREFVYQFNVGCFVNGGGVEDTDWPNISTCQKLREID